MFRLLGAAVLAGLSVLAQTSIPDTPAGRVLRAWLDAFNSGDKARIEAYLRTHEPDKSPDEMLGFRDQTGGFELLGVDKSERNRIDFRVKEAASATQARGRLEVTDSDPPTVARFSLRAGPPGELAAAAPIDSATRTRVIDGALLNLKEYYVFPDTAARMD